MKTPDIPQECGLHEYGHNSGIWKGGGAYFDISLKGGRAALAAYCTAVIDEMIREALQQIHIDADFGENLFLSMLAEWLFSWRDEWSRYGGFTR